MDCLKIFCRNGLCPAIVAGLLSPSQSSAQTFEDVSSEAGLSYAGESWGASWGDLNGDRYPDLYASHHRLLPSLYLNLGDGTFSDVALGDELSGLWTDPEKALADLHGGSWADFDNDGDLDLYLSAGASDANQFLVNEGGRLVYRTPEYDPLITQWRARQPLWFDFSGDGKLDFFMASENVAPVFEQTEAGFVNRSAPAAFACDRSQVGVLANLTGGGALEIICVTNIFPSNAYEYPRLPFTRVTPALPRTGSVLDVAVADFDGDLTTDVFLVKGAKRLSGALQVGANRVEAQLLANFSGQKGIAFNSAGDITISLAVESKLALEDVHIGAGGRHPPGPLDDKHSMTFTVAANDPNAAGIAAHSPSRDRGVYVGYNPSTQQWQLFNSPGGDYSYAYASIAGTQPVSNVSASGLAAGDLPTAPQLFLHDAASFTDATLASGLGNPISCVAAAAGDFDNDRDVDLYLVCREAIANQANRLYENQGDGTFQLASAAAGAAGPTGFGSGKGENVVLADYDVDGFLDLFVTNGLQMVPIGPGGPDLLFHNAGTNGNHWVELDLEGTVSNRDGVGARVFATTPDGKIQLREQNGGYHRWSQHSQRIHFGLGEYTEADISVEWPGETIDTFPAVAADSLYRVVEGGVIQPLVPGEIPPSVPVVSIDDVRVAENGGDAVFELRLSAASDQEISVDFATQNGSAVTPDDYAAASGTLTFAPGETTKPITVSIIDDSLPEGDETFTVMLSNAVNAVLGRTATTATITDDEAPPCGMPTYDKTAEQGVFIGKDCATDVWRVRMTAGGGSASFQGSLNSAQPFSHVTGFSVEPSDTLDFSTDPAAIAYRLNVDNIFQDGFDFTIPVGADVCFGLDAPSGASVLVGPNRTPVSVPFDLATLGSCP